jgi:hypothetical protein
VFVAFVILVTQARIARERLLLASELMSVTPKATIRLVIKKKTISSKGSGASLMPVVCAGSMVHVPLWMAMPSTSHK